MLNNMCGNTVGTNAGVCCSRSTALTQGLKTCSLCFLHARRSLPVIPTALQVEAKQDYLMGFINIGGSFWGLFQELPSLLRVHAG